MSEKYITKNKRIHIVLILLYKTIKNGYKLRTQFSTLFLPILEQTLKSVCKCMNTALCEQSAFQSCKFYHTTLNWETIALCEQSAFVCSKILPYNFKLRNNFNFTCKIVYKAYLPMPIIIVLYIALLFQLLIVVDFIGVWPKGIGIPNSYNYQHNGHVYKQ